MDGKGETRLPEACQQWEDGMRKRILCNEKLFNNPFKTIAGVNRREHRSVIVPPQSTLKEGQEA
jgi:hypothetical protein